MGNTSFVFLGLQAAWCIVVAVLLSIMGRGSFWSYNQSFMVLTVPVLGILSVIGLLYGIAGSFARNNDKTISIIGAGINAVVLLVVVFLTL